MGVAVVEVILRIVNSNDAWFQTREANILWNFQFPYEISQLYWSDTSSIDYLRNQYGLRDTCKSPAEIEILTIGGSTTDKRYVSMNSTY